MANEKHTNWLEDAFDDEKNAQLEEELQRAHAKSRITVIVLLVVIAIVAIFVFMSCSAALSFLEDSHTEEEWAQQQSPQQ